MSDLAMFTPECGVGQQPSRLNLAPKSMRFWLMAHKIAAGFSAPASDPIGAGPELSKCLVQDQAGAFLFSVTGNSMSGAGIMEGDKVIVDRSVQPVHGRIVIAVVNAEYTLKRLFHFNGRFELRSENECDSPVRIVDEHEPEIWGVVVGVIRNYRS